MRLTRVHIGTTEGPAEIQRLTPEPPQIRSVVCLDGRAVSLPISRDYESFIRRPTGLIERLWGGEAFRMDVGARITDGLSWQLGAFLAHGLFEAGALATRGVAADAVVWATGEVDAALVVRPVEEVARKLELSADVLRGVAASRPLVLVPTDVVELARTTLERIGLAASCRVVGVATAADALVAIGVALPAGLAPTAATMARPRKHAGSRRSAWRVALAAMAVLLLPLAAAAGWVGWDWRTTIAAWTEQARAGDLIALDTRLDEMEGAAGCLTCATAVRLFRDWLGRQIPPDGAPVVEIEETRRVSYGGCGGGPGSPPPRIALSGSHGAPVSVGVCRVRYIVSGASFVALIVFAPGMRQTPDPSAVGASEAAVTLDLPALSIYPSEQRIVALASRLPLEAALAWLRPQLSADAADLPGKLAARLATLGVAARVLRHRIDPGRGI